MRPALAVGLVLLVGLVGCSREPPPAETLTDEELAKCPAVDPAQLKALLAEQKGKVVVLAVWSVRREACVAMCPRLGELAKAGGAGPVVVAVNIDRVADVREKVLPMIGEPQPPLLHRVVHGGPDALATFIGEEWMGAVPAIALYDRQGKRVAAFFGDDALPKAQERLAKLLPKR